MTPAEFIKKWKPVALTERAAAHTHFLDLCKLFEHEDPVSADPTGEWFTFEKGATKTGGGEGFADVWKKNFFAWEYKKKKRDLNAAMDQLVRYAAALENPPLQVVCDTDRFIVRTAWTNAVPKQYEIELDDLALPEKREILWAVFHDPERLRPKETRAGITKEAADKFSTIALRLQGRGTPEEVAHFVNQLVFCFFANSVKLLPEGFFPKLLKRAGQRPDRAQEYFNSLFAAMEHGDEYDMTDIAYFNGGLFDGRPAIRLDDGDIGLLIAAGSLDWSLIDPTIFGTLFERFLDPDKRAQIGAHYTDPDKIMMIVEPVILRPLRAEWEAIKVEIEKIAEEANALQQTQFSKAGARSFDKRITTIRARAEAIRDQFIERLRKITILDPACGSGNFLYLALQGVKDIELKANLECEALGLAPRVPVIGPEIVHGIEINPLAAELARTTIWIGDIQWRLRNGIYARPDPILRKLEAIECRDALITETKDGFVEAEWPPAEFIVGNPLLRRPMAGLRIFPRKRRWRSCLS
jgi:type II restriction/modification system DNA methylase subunit YeeA